MNSTYLVNKVFILALFVSGVIILLFWANTDTLRLDNGNPVNVHEKHQDMKNKLCHVNHKDERNILGNKTNVKMIYFVTPTYPRPVQIPELTRLGHTLMHVPHLHWIVVDDQPICSDQVLGVLWRTGLPFTHISSPIPHKYTKSKARGVANRRAALAWIRKNVFDGILYFGDDDNTYDLRLFEEIRLTKAVSMFPVGMIGEYGVSSPVVKNGKVVAFFDSWPGGRIFPVDMAGFAINLKYLKPAAVMPYAAGQEENKFLISLGVKLEEIEPLADNCSKIYVWHTKTVKFAKHDLQIDMDKLNSMSTYTGFANLLKEVVKLGMANIVPGNAKTPYITRNRSKYDVISGLL